MVAVICMTIFSALWSLLTKNQFIEPCLLNEIFDRLYGNDISKEANYLLAWILHFLFGFMFLGFYECLWYAVDMDRNIISSFYFGAYSGALGIIGWASLFKILNFKLDINLTHYYIHLFFAHIVFSSTAVITYKELASLL